MYLSFLKIFDNLIELQRSGPDSGSKGHFQLGTVSRLFRLQLIKYNLRK